MTNQTYKPDASMDFNLALDVLYGCKWSCDGCHVSKEGQSDKELFAGDDKKIISLLDDFIANGFNPKILILNATDIFTASNTIAIMETENFRRILKRFERLGFNSTFLQPADDVLAAINTLSADKEIEFKIVVEARQFMNDKYLTRVRDGVLKAQKAIKCTKFVIHPQFNLFDYRETKFEEILRDYQMLNDRAFDFFGQGIDYVLSFSRSEEVSREHILEMITWIKDMFNEHVNQDNAAIIHFDAAHLQDFGEKIYTYRNGNFYYAPKIHDEYVAFDEEMIIPVNEWTAEEFIRHENDLIVSQYANLHNKPCINCHYAPTCTSRGIPFFMDFMDTTECIMPKDAFDVINYQIPKAG